MPSGDDAVSAGRKLYKDNGCGACHGPNGAGDGPLARSLPKRPRDLRDPASYQYGTDAASIAETIGKGLMDKGVGMPAYSHIPERQRRELAAFLISLRE